MKKVPKFGANPAKGKTPKTTITPELAKSHNVSWQFNRIDMDSRWGLTNIINSTSFSFNNELLQELPEDLSDPIYKALCNLDGKTFKSTDYFLNRLAEDSSNTVSAEEQKIILKSIQENIFWSEILPKLKELEKINWFELEKQQFGSKGKTKHHFIEVSKIIPEAKKRLEQLKLDDHDELFSIRLSGAFRIWGIRQFGYLQILWFDQGHEICPVGG